MAKRLRPTSPYFLYQAHIHIAYCHIDSGLRAVQQTIWSALAIANIPLAERGASDRELHSDQQR